MSSVQQQPEWLRRMTYGLSDGRQARVLIDGERFAIVQCPGGRFMNGQESQYGATVYHLVDKNQPDFRGGTGLIQMPAIQTGGRAKLVQWRPLVEASDKAGKLITEIKDGSDTSGVGSK